MATPKLKRSVSFRDTAPTPDTRNCGEPPTKILKSILKTYSNDKRIKYDPKSLPFKTVPKVEKPVVDLDLECVVEQLEPAQIQYRNRIENDAISISVKIDELTSSDKSRIIVQGRASSLIEIDKALEPPTPPPPPPVPRPPPPTPSLLLKPPAGTSYQLVVDPRLGNLLVSTAVPQSISGGGSTSVPPPLQLVSTTTTVPKPTVGGGTTTTTPPPLQLLSRPTIVNTTTVIPTTATTTTTAAKTVVATVRDRKQRNQSLAGKLPPPPPLQKRVPAIQRKMGPPPPPPPVPSTPPTSPRLPALKPRPLAQITTKTTAPTPVPQTTVTVTKKKEPPPKTPSSSNATKGTTYPSLVVIARPHLTNIDPAIDRARLDTRVKNVLMYTPTKFTEWLIQQGLLRSDQRCKRHPNKPMKLGMFRDTSKYPHSGGYIWISECCPTEFTQVFEGSLFENIPHLPLVLLKLIYHWCCQTSIQNVTQWVTVDNTYVKQVYTSLRGVCTIATHSHIGQIGGPGIKVQIGLISLGTTSGVQATQAQQKQVKVEVMGAMEIPSKIIRLRAIKPIPEFQRSYRARFCKILEPLMNWVHPSSILVTDMSVDKTTLHKMGFMHVLQAGNEDFLCNNTIMTYLRRAVPRMFQNTLAHLSHAMIQQFLDELVWREQFGTTVLTSYENIVKHIVEQTKYYQNRSLLAVLNAVTADPFRNWAILTATNKKASSAANNIVGTPPPPLNNNSSSSSTTTNNKKVVVIRKPPEPVEKVKRPAPIVYPQQTVPLENYYYGTIKPTVVMKPKSSGGGNLNVRCVLCKTVYRDNIALMEHLFKHAHNVVTNRALLCRYCLASAQTNYDLDKHVASCHPVRTRFDNGFMCLICETRFMTPTILGKHMSKTHCPFEMPYMCGVCGYRCSNHRQAIDHFYQVHLHGNAIQCPFCLRTITIQTNGRNVADSLTYFVQHLQKHKKNAMAQKCDKCNLWFVQENLMKEHTDKMHLSQRGRRDVIPYAAPRSCFMVPKSMLDNNVSNVTETNDNVKSTTDSWTLNVTDPNLVCKECTKPLNTLKHFTSLERCSVANCKYMTWCSAAIKQHTANCRTSNEEPHIPIEVLPFELYCVCGHTNRNGNEMARHLAVCEKKSAYPTLECAKAAIVKQSMLNVLGLVRRTDDLGKTDVTDPRCVVKQEMTYDIDDVPLAQLKDNPKPTQIAG